jgi:ABC-type transport system substrate-binding protein
MGRTVNLAITVLVVLSFLLACAAPAPTVAPTKPSAPAAATTAPAPPSEATSAPAAATQPAATAPTTASVAKIKRGGVVKYGVPVEPSPTLDPHTANTSGWPFENLYGSFTKYVRDDKTGKWDAKPGMAESWERTDSKTMIFKLRKGIKFHDGTMFDAKVAKWNLERMMTHKQSTVRPSLRVLGSVDVVDDYTIKLNLKAPPAGLLAVLSDSNFCGYIVSQTQWEKLGDEAGRQPIGAGPMQFVQWKTGDNITLKKWDQYWDKGDDGQPLPYLDGIVYQVVPDATVRVLSLKTGAIDGSDDLPAKEVTPFKNDPNFQVLLGDWRTMSNYFFFNTTRAPWKDNVKLRQAAQYAIDKQAMANTLGFGLGKPAYYHWGASDVGYDESIPKYDFQPEKAKQLMQEAGHPNGFETELIHWPTWPNVEASQMFQSFWAKIGIKATLKPVERTASMEAWASGNYNTGLSQKDLGEVDVSLVEYRFRANEFKNFALLINPEVDKCFDEAGQAPEDGQRAEVYKRCQRIIHEDAGTGVAWQWLRNNVYAKYVKGWTPSWRGEPNWTRVWLDK